MYYFKFLLFYYLDIKYYFKLSYKDTIFLYFLVSKFVLFSIILQQSKKIVHFCLNSRNSNILIIICYFC